MFRYKTTRIQSMQELIEEKTFQAIRSTPDRDMNKMIEKLQILLKKRISRY